MENSMKKLLLAGSALLMLSASAHAVPLDQIEPAGYICEGNIGGSATVLFDPQAGTVYWQIKNHPVHIEYDARYEVLNAFGHTGGSPPFYIYKAYFGAAKYGVYGDFEIDRREWNLTITPSLDEQFMGRCIGNYEAAAKLKENAPR
jgi:hypothetical protein